MDFLKSQIDRIQAQISALTPTQRMLTGTLVAIMIMTVMWWSRYAGTADMEPFLDQALTPEQMKNIEANLAQKNIEFKESNQRILVPTDHKFQALSTLAFDGVLPKDTASGFDEMIKQLSPWDGVGRQDAMFNHGKELDLERTIGLFPDVVEARVKIDPTTRRQIGDGNITARASIWVKMKPGIKPGKQLVKSAAMLVAGAQSGLDMKNIMVIVDNAPQKIPDAQSDGSSMDAGTILEVRQKAESDLEQKLRDQFGEIQGLFVAVRVSVNNQSTTTDTTTVDERKSGHFETKTNTETHEQTGPAASPAEPGAAPNTGVSIAAAPSAAGGGNTSTDNKETAEYENVPAIKKEKTDTPAGTNVIPVSASVRIPRSHFVNVAKIEANDTKEPDPQSVSKVIETERQKIAKSVANTLGLTDPSVVAVDDYADAMPLAAIEPPVTAASTITLALGGHVKEIALGALALVSLFMVSSMVKKAGPAMPAPVAGAAGSAAAPQRSALGVLGGSEMVAGEAGDGGTLLNAVEMDEESVRNQQMMEQVATLVDENPDTAATLVKRWMNRG